MLQNATRPDGRGARTILVVDDDERVREVVSWQLEAEGFAVGQAGDGPAALQSIAALPPDLVVLDLSLPGLGGLDVLRRLRQQSRLPVIILSGRNGETDRIVGLDLGADDYLVKPFSPEELAARVRSVLRRCEPAGVAESADPDDSAGGTGGTAGVRLRIDSGSREVTVDGQVVELTAKEFDLIAFLSAHPRHVFTRAQLLEHVWRSDPGWQCDATVTEHVHRVRHKVEPDPAHPRWLRTIRGVGYRWEPGP
ncbi:response regulator transcription factor [Nakamurella sp. UYEF19]|uniref:response regulator transcription factor n=1 Tax=Nakamurella sp. UYEF19 TaxID=1756392 RepID=UPI0033931F00